MRQKTTDPIFQADEGLAIHGGTPARAEAIFTGVWPSNNARAQVAEMMNSGLLSNYYSGPWARKFERAFAAYFGPEYRGVSVNSGTSALHLALTAADIGSGDEVIVPAFCFVAAVTAIVQNGAIPVICDAEPASLTMSADRIKELITPRTKAVLVVHFWGHPAEMDAITKLCHDNGVNLIEDCAQAFGAQVLGQSVGTFSDFVTYAFSVRKHISCGEGGMVMCNGEAHHERLRVLANYGKGPDWDDYDSAGFSYRMAEFPAIVGLDGLARLDDEIAARQYAGDCYAQVLPREGLEPVVDPAWGRSAFFKCPVMVPDSAKKIRGELVKAIGAENISCRIPHRPLFRIEWLNAYLQEKGALMTADDCPIARDAHPRLIELETGPHLPPPEVAVSCEGALKVWRHFANSGS
ncbi:DegT/DnrJ/EryC1/StrS family aminotransferase [Rhodophyticola sp. CCM32]|uniref:DegT/DnrJ/EryC1/StrS family aminotransferase n=1 Tax=Rhodophyticola sp. CCM32 TaxID=2916397 RepID=UPI00107F44F5|nr:DegT/DnrJ/EryC1/StrS family aminotransferase [Rhodophyticola sp. CCM32]QBY00139.1 DegT/DnrJ/EryC1/StrS family aminotransferase [Rhodophyticola sp. CCM32]